MLLRFLLGRGEFEILTNLCVSLITQHQSLGQFEYISQNVRYIKFWNFIQFLYSLKLFRTDTPPLRNFENRRKGGGICSEISGYDNDFWCKRNLNIHTLRCKSFLPPSLLFYPPFFTWEALTRLKKCKFYHSFDT